MKKNISLKTLITSILIIYIPFHLTEEAMGNFHLWMADFYQLSQPISFKHWLINNGIFLLVLASGYFIYRKNSDKYLPFGIGILIWGFMNSLEHFTGSIISGALIPGFWTAVLFFACSVLAFIKIHKEKIVRRKKIIQSIIAGIVYWIIALNLIVLIGKTLLRLFPA